jgi:hypothetical protein
MDDAAAEASYEEHLAAVAHTDAVSPITPTDAVDVTDTVKITLEMTIEDGGEIRLEVDAPRALTFVAMNRLVETMKDKVRELRTGVQQ